ncbi:MAG: tetratricopeptide repeat protein [Chromatiales bacterium]|nr:tetratricopeptide repeat protein [Chromatiales bacterium]
MGDLMNLAVYNPAILSDADFLAGFVARRSLADGLLDQLRDLTPSNLAKHHLILGQRGMGKTSLLRRIGLGVSQDATLAGVLLPLSFREEQYNIHDLHSFWCNCLDALANWLERDGRAEQADELDRATLAIARDQSDPEGTAARELFQDWMKREQRRALLLLDNIDLILAGLGAQDWSLRRILQQAGGIVVIGATASYLESTEDPQAAFYDFFRVTVLERLSAEELPVCLNRLADARGAEGGKVKQLVARDPARIRTLYDLTGGNPRTLVLLYLLLELDSGGDVFSDLERLLDQVTPLYKARIEDLAPQPRVVLDALALHWDPATAAQLAELTGLATPAVSAQLDRLLKSGLLEKVPVSASKRTAFQLGERFFNIWYLMRHGPRRQRTRLRWLTGFLRGFYTPEQLRARGKSLLQQADGSHLHYDYTLAMSDAVDDSGLRYLLGAEGRKGMEAYALANGKRLEDLTDPDDLPQPQTAVDWYNMGWWLHTQLERYDEAEQAYRRAIEIDPKYAYPWNGLGNLLADHRNRPDEAEQAYRRAIEIDPEFVWPWNNLGIVLVDDLNRPDEAEQAYRRAIEIDPKDAWPWNGLGNLLMSHLNRPGEAEQAYRRAIEIDPEFAWPWNGLGILLVDHLNRPDDAEQAYRRAIEIDPEFAPPWNNLGNLLMDDLNRPEEAEQAYRRAIEIDPEFAPPWNGLGSLLADHRNRPDEAEQAYRRAIEIDPGYTAPMVNLAFLLATQPARQAELDALLSDLLPQLPPYAAALLSAYLALAQDNFGAAAAQFGAALDSEDPALFSTHQDDVLRVLRLAAARGYGDRLLTWLDDHGLGDRYWPLRAAFDAYLHGEDRLLDVNPEVRTAAKRLLAWLNRVPAPR